MPAVLRVPTSEASSTFAACQEQHSKQCWQSRQLQTHSILCAQQAGDVSHLHAGFKQPDSTLAAIQRQHSKQYWQSGQIQTHGIFSEVRPHLHDGFKQPDSSLSHSFPEGSSGGYLEGQNTGVHVMIGSIIQCCLHIHHWEACK